MPRTFIEKDDLFGEDVLSKFDHAYPIEMYIKSVDGFQGEGDFLSKFGLEIRDEMVLTVAKRRFEDEIHPTESTPVEEDEGMGRPSEGDLIYFPLNGKIFEVKFVEHESIFYQMGSLQTYDLSLELFEYSYETIETGYKEIDQSANTFSAITEESYLPFAEAVATVTGQFVTSITVSDELGGGGRYTTAPTVTISNPPETIGASANVTVSNTGFITDFPISVAGRGYISQPTVSVEGVKLVDGYAVSEKKYGDYSFKVGVKETDTLFTRGESLEEGIFGFYVNVPSTNNVVYGRFMSLEDTSESWDFHVANTSQSQFRLQIIGDETFNIDNLDKGEWHYIAIGLEIDLAENIYRAYHNDREVANTTGPAGYTLFERYITMTNTRAGNVYVDHVFVDSDPTANALDPNTFFSNSGTRSVLLDFENPTTNTFSVFTTANVNANGAVTSVVIPTVSGNEIISANVLIQDAPEGIPATATATLTAVEGTAYSTVTSITITNQGSGYVNPPTVRVSAEEVESSNYVTLEDGGKIIDESFEFLSIDSQTDNKYFEQKANTEFIDFSEINPFSEGERW